MEYIYAALLLDAAGKELNEENIKSVIKAAGMAPDEAMAKSVASSLKGVNIKDVIKNAQAMQAAPAAATKAKASSSDKAMSQAKPEAEQLKRASLPMSGS